MGQNFSDDAVKVAFRRFPSNFNAMEFFVPLIENALQRPVLVTSTESAELLFDSVYLSRSSYAVRRFSRGAWNYVTPRPSGNKDKQKAVWFTAENIRPPLDGYDLYLSFDLDPYDERNLYLPLLFLSLDWFGNQVPISSGVSSRLGIRPTPFELTQTRTVNAGNRSKFACAFVGNPEPTRLRAIEMLREIGEIDVYGSYVGRSVSTKIEVAKNYRFMLCFENDLFPGYVTEKVLDAYACGCVPLYWGLDSFGLINAEAIVNAADYPTLRDFAEVVAALEVDKEKISEISNSPLMLRAPDLSPIMSAMNLVFGNTSGVTNMT